MSAEQHNDPMNLDDFIIPTSMASPAGIPTPMSSENTPAPIFSHGQAIPIDQRSKPHIHIPPTAPAASVPKTSLPNTRNAEFGYVQKRVRKTSNDERRSVSLGAPDIAIPF